jgi:formate hydrogenlyase subunit 3/multisubunit Na+/H+ antiporter MnhD subunit
MNEFFFIISNHSVCSFLQSLIILPLVAGILLFLIPDKYMTVKGIISLFILILSGYLTISLFNSSVQMAIIKGIIGKSCNMLFGSDFSQGADKYFTFTIDNLSKLIALFIGVLSILILLYSVVYIRYKRIKHFYTWFLLTVGCSYGAVLSDNLLLFLTFWGILGMTLYKLIPGHNEDSSATAKKTLILIGASDSIMIIGIAILWRLTGSLSMNYINLPTTNILSVTAFLALIVGSFTKAGVFPFHSWVPDYAKDAPASSSAFLPASLDKLLGIYFLARITTDIFIPGECIRLFLLLIGVITIISAVMMALIQHNYKKLLGFHAVSQVGYMIVGFGLGSMIGVAAGLFHMINNVLYKSGLFLSAGCVEYRTGEENLDDLGGLSKAMPVTFVSSLVFAMAISGVPPFNGFASKWMIYQGIIDFGSGPGIANKLWVVWLSMTVLGSALTLASFIKFIGGIFLSRRKNEFEKIREVPVLMWIPMAVLALSCIGFGVFATNFVVPKFFMPVTGEFYYSGFWNSSFVSLLVLISIVLGIVLYLSLNLAKFRSEDSFIGGEKIQEQTSYATSEFYKTIGEFRLFSWIYRKAEEKWFDIYDLAKRFVLWMSHLFSETHSGVLSEYVLWVFAGVIILLLIMS